MPEEFQPYFYLSHKDLHSPKPGKMVGVILIFSAVILILFKVTGSEFSWAVIGLILAIGVTSLYLGKVVHNHKTKGQASNDETDEDRKFAY